MSIPILYFLIWPDPRLAALKVTTLSITRQMRFDGILYTTSYCLYRNIMILFFHLLDMGTCGGKVCCKNSMCMNYHCVCKNGFYGNGYDICLRKLMYINHFGRCGIQDILIRSFRIISIPSKVFLFLSARPHDFDGMLGTGLPLSMYTTKNPINTWQ